MEATCPQDEILQWKRLTDKKECPKSSTFSLFVTDQRENM